MSHSSMPSEGRDHTSTIDVLMDPQPDNPSTDPKLDKALENVLFGLQKHSPLTKREKEILGMVLNGHTNREIAERIYRTERTVEYHRNRVMRKLGTRNTIELVKCAIAMGIA